MDLGGQTGVATVCPTWRFHDDKPHVRLCKRVLRYPSLPNHRGATRPHQFIPCVRVTNHASTTGDVVPPVQVKLPRWNKPFP